MYFQKIYYKNIILLNWYFTCQSNCNVHCTFCAFLWLHASDRIIIHNLKKGWTCTNQFFKRPIPIWYSSLLVFYWYVDIPIIINNLLYFLWINLPLLWWHKSRINDVEWPPSWPYSENLVPLVPLHSMFHIVFLFIVNYFQKCPKKTLWFYDIR